MFFKDIDKLQKEICTKIIKDQMLLTTGRKKPKHYKEYRKNERKKLETYASNTE